MDNKMKYAQKLKEARTNAGLTQLDAARAIQRPQQTLAAWETGRSQPDANTLSELLQLYRVSPNDFFEYDDVPTHVSNAEYNHIKKYRTLDEYGKDLVDTVLDLEHARCTAQPSEAASPAPAKAPELQLTDDKRGHRLQMVARRVEGVPEAEYERILQNFEDTIDTYLQAKRTTSDGK